MTPAEQKIVNEVLAEAWDDGFEHCRAAAALICAANGRADLAAMINAIPLKKPSGNHSVPSYPKPS